MNLQPNWTPELEETSLNGIQQEIYDFLIEYRKEHGCSPTRKEIGYKIGKASGSVQVHLGQIEDKGYISLQIGRWRGIVIAKRDDMSERERFERWAESRHYYLKRIEYDDCTDEYFHRKTAEAWEVWQARAALGSGEES